MIRNKYLFFIVVLFALNSFTQNEVLKLPIPYEATLYEGKESLAISNEKTGDLVLFVEDYNKAFVFLLNKNLEVISELETEGLPVFFKNFIGYQINENNSYSMFFANGNNKKYGILNLDFKEKKSNNINLNFKLKEEVYVESISFNDAFYLMSVTKKGSDVHFYTFDEKGSILNKKTVPFDFLEEAINGYSKKAYNYLVTKNLGPSGSLVKMDIDIPNGIEITSKPNKLYVIDNQFVFTFDNDKTKTKVITLSPSTFEILSVEFEQLKINKTDFSNNNSYLYDNKIFQVISSSQEMKFTVKDLKSKELLKKIELKKEDIITFKNTPIVQEAGTSNREMEETSKFLRKVSRGNIGVSVYKQNENYEITLGSKIVRGNAGGFGGMPMGDFGGIPMGSFGPISVSFNPTFYAYGGYSSSKITHIDCLFNNDFRHVDGDIQKNVFDRIKNVEEEFKNTKYSIKQEKRVFGYRRYEDDNFNKSNNAEFKSNTPELKNVFRHNGKLYFGFIGAYDKNYHLIEFID